jgi:hypothetical protein
MPHDDLLTSNAHAPLPGALIGGVTNPELQHRRPPTIMLVGTPDETAIILHSLLKELSQPVYEYERSGSCPAPHGNDAAGTVIIREVATFSAIEQQQVFDWLTSAAGSNTVVTICKAPLWPLVQCHLFRADLFYRLNVHTVISPSEGSRSADVSSLV